MVNLALQLYTEIRESINSLQTAETGPLIARIGVGDLDDETPGVVYSIEKYGSPEDILKRGSLRVNRFNNSFLYSFALRKSAGVALRTWAELYSSTRMPHVLGRIPRAALS